MAGLLVGAVGVLERWGRAGLGGSTRSTSDWKLEE